MQIDDFLALAKARRTIRRFKPDPIPDESIEKVLDAARWAQSGGNGQPWEFIVVKDKDTKISIVELVIEAHKYTTEIEQSRVAELRHPAYGGDRRGIPVETFLEAPVFIVMCVDPRAVQATVLESQYLPAEGGPYAHVLKNMANATQILTLAITASGLASQWVSISCTIEPRLKVLLDVPVELAIHTIIPVGYPAYTPAPPYRRELKDIIHYEKYDRSKYRSGADIYDFILNLRKRTKPSYPHKI
jgi:5,6-dimethylbenzimidazole synthase